MDDPAFAHCAATERIIERPQLVQTFGNDVGEGRQIAL